MNDAPLKFDPEYITFLLKVSADRFRDLEQALLGAQKAMTQLAAALAGVAEYLPKDELPAPDEGEWRAANAMVRQ